MPSAVNTVLNPWLEKLASPGENSLLFFYFNDRVVELPSMVFLYHRLVPLVSGKLAAALVVLM